jgi:hypothetical protein
VSKFRDAQRDLDAVTAELEPLKFALEFFEHEVGTLDDEAKGVPVAGILGNLEGVVKQIATCLSKEGEMRLARRIRWALSGREEMERLRCSLEAYESTLDLALDVLAL